MKQSLENIWSFIHRKFVVIEKNSDTQTESRWKKLEQWNQVWTYIEELQSEIEEMKAEMKENNSVYLEDELWDILWDYLNIVYLLEKKGYIDAQGVIERCEKKFGERIIWSEKDIPWNEVKQQQKQELLAEHNTKYNS